MNFRVLGAQDVSSARGLWSQCLAPGSQEGTIGIFASCIQTYPGERLPAVPPLQSPTPISLQFPKNDPKLKTQGKCMPFFRAGFVCPTPPYQSLAREQINAVTSFLDASLVYGSEPSLASRLQNLSSPLGLMAVNQEAWDHGLAYLPFNNRKPSPCEFINTTARVPCFLAGESRLGIEGPKDKGIILGTESRGRPEELLEGAGWLPSTGSFFSLSSGKIHTESPHWCRHWSRTGRRAQTNTGSRNMCSVYVKKKKKKKKNYENPEKHKENKKIHKIPLLTDNHR